MDQFLQFLIFQLGQKLFAVRLSEVLDITHNLEITHLPKTDDKISGFSIFEINDKPNIVTILDTQKLLQIVSNNNRILLLTYKDALYGIYIDDIVEIIPMSKKALMAKQIDYKGSMIDIFSCSFVFCNYDMY